MAEQFDESRYTALFDTVCVKVLGEEAWAALDKNDQRRVKQGWLPIILAIDEFRDGETFKPKRDDDVATWLKRLRDEAQDPINEAAQPREWHLLDGLLDDYRLHADTGTPLSMDAVEGPGEPL